MTLALAGSLVVLALLDSTSIGTFFVPILLMLAPGRLRAVPILGYLVTIAAFYLALGIAVALGAGSPSHCSCSASASTRNAVRRKESRRRSTGPSESTGPPAHPARW
ncbi:MAG: hypothetical protein LC635_05775 [Pseudonocardiaceae bacterium]|nr:hypothetical protein [Pseudonocardiaceae bacterium]